MPRKKADKDYSEFEQRATSMLTECNDDVIQIKDVYAELQQEAGDDARKRIRLRELYDIRLLKLALTSKPNNSNQEAATNNTEVESIAEQIRWYRAAFKCNMPVHKDCESWTEERLWEHLAFWVNRHSGNAYKQSCNWLVAHPDIDERRKYVACELSMLEQSADDEQSVP